MFKDWNCIYDDKCEISFFDRKQTKEIGNFLQVKTIKLGILLSTVMSNHR